MEFRGKISNIENSTDSDSSDKLFKEGLDNYCGINGSSDCINEVINPKSETADDRIQNTEIVEENEHDRDYLSNLDIDNIIDRNILNKVLVSDLKHLGIENTSAKILSKIIILRDPTISEISTGFSLKNSELDDRLDKLKDINWIEFTTSEYGGRQFVHYKLTISPDELYQIIETKNSTIIKEFTTIIEELPTHINKFEEAYNQGFLKINYLPEYQNLVSKIVSLGIAEDAAKLLIGINYLDLEISALNDVIGIQEKDSLGLIRNLFNAGWIKSRKFNCSYYLKYSLTSSIYDIALDYAYHKSLLIENCLNEFKLILSIVDKYYVNKENNKKSLNELQSKFVSSFRGTLKSYKKLSENVLDLQMSNKFQSIRACIVELVLSKNGKNLVLKEPLKDNILDDEKEIMLYGYCIDYQQYVVWNFADTYKTLKMRSIIVPINLIDDITGKKLVIERLLPSNSKIITVPEKHPYKAITYWSNVKAKEEDKWFI